MKIDIDQSKCTFCGVCVRACPEHAISIEYELKVYPEQCMGCGICVSVCESWNIKPTPLQLRSGRVVLINPIACSDLRSKYFCKECIESCPRDIFSLEGKIILSEEDCIECQICAEACQLGAISIKYSLGDRIKQYLKKISPA